MIQTKVLLHPVIKEVAEIIHKHVTDENAKQAEWVLPYMGDFRGFGRVTSLRHFRGYKGVYLICEHNVLVYVGMSNYSVNKALYRHFQRWTDRRQYRVTYNADTGNYFVAILPVGKTDDAGVLERLLIKALNPRDNREKYEYDHANSTNNEHFEQTEEPNF